jgi:hypothetical protein
MWAHDPNQQPTVLACRTLWTRNTGLVFTEYVLFDLLLTVDAKWSVNSVHEDALIDEVYEAAARMDGFQYSDD